MLGINLKFSILEKFKSFVDAIDTPGGHIITCLFVGVLGIIIALGAIAHWGWDDKRVDIILKITAPLEGFLPIAAYAMRGIEKANGKTATSSTSTTTVSTVQAPASGPEPPPVPTVPPTVPSDSAQQTPQQPA